MPNESLEEIRLEVKKLIIQTLNFKDVKPEEIIDNLSFFTGENTIKIDSIDALEIAVLLDRQYGIKITAEDNRNQAIFASLNSLAEFIAANRTK